MDEKETLDKANCWSNHGLVVAMIASGEAG